MPDMLITQNTYLRRLADKHSRVSNFLRGELGAIEAIIDSDESDGWKLEYIKYRIEGFKEREGATGE